MRKLLFVLLMISTNFLWAQSTGFNYKALITQNGNALANQPVNVQFTLLDDTATSIYTETQSATTDANGIISLIIGEGTSVNGDFATIDWANTYNLKVEIDTQDGNGYQDYGTNTFKYMPYAKYADKAGNVFSGNYADLQGAPDTTNWDKDVSDDVTKLDDLSDAKNDGKAVFIGNNAGLHLTNHFSNNVGIGTRALQDATTAEKNVAVGFEAMMDNVTGTRNVAIGDRAIYQNLNSYNTALGFNTLYNNINGNNNVAIGYNAGFSNTGNNNIFIGSDAGYNETGSDKLYIDNTDTNNPLIYGDFANDYIKINGELHGQDSGDADMKAYIYGCIYSSGNISSTGASSDGFTVTKVSTGKYKVTFNQSPGGRGNYTVIASMNYGFLGFISVVNHDSYFEVRTYNTSAAVSDESFNFVVYKK